MDTLALAASVAAGCVGGVFLAFVCIVMPALNRLPAPASIAAMQAINVAAVRPLFMIVLFGTAALCVLLVVLGFGDWSSQRGPLLVLGGGVYLIGAIGVTIVGNVPLNNRLAAVTPVATPVTTPGARSDTTSADAAEQWSRFVAPWARLNSVRTAASIAAAVLLALAAG